MHGEDLAKAHAANALHAGSRGMTSSPAFGGTDLSQRAQRVPVSISGLIALAGETQKLAADRNYSLEALSGRALDIATRLAGSIPTPAPDLNARSIGGSIDEPASALDAVQQQVGAVQAPLFAMEPNLHRLAAALDAIERTLS